MSDSLPKRYKPRCLRDEKQLKKINRPVQYALGFKSEQPGSTAFSMTHGPAAGYRSLLDEVPDRRFPGVGDHLIRFNSNGTDEVLYVWNWEDQSWERQTDNG